MIRGDVYDARLSPTEGSEQAGMRPVIIVSRNAINQYSPVIVVVPLTDAANLKRTYPSDVLIRQPEGGLTLELGSVDRPGAGYCQDAPFATTGSVVVRGGGAGCQSIARDHGPVSGRAALH